MARILITRPQHDAQPWVDALRARGLDAAALPLMAIGPCTDPASQQALIAARQAARTSGHYRAVMFVSGNAVQYFFAKNRPDVSEYQGYLAINTRSWTPGPGTARALLALGMDPAQIDGPPAHAAQFESETLWQQVHEQIQPSDRVLIVRGDSGASPATTSGPAPTNSTAGAGRDWLAAQLRKAGAQVEFLAVYQRQLPQWNTQQIELACEAASDGSLWLFSSSEAVANLQQLLPEQSWQQGRALATHDRIASKAREAGFGVVVQSRPALQDVLASIESMA